MIKRSLTAAAAAILVGACADTPTQPSAGLLATSAVRGIGANTTVVCHTSGNSGAKSLLNIDGNALGAHLAHGDFQAGSAKLLANGYILFPDGTRFRGPFPHEYLINVSCSGFAGTGLFLPDPLVTEVITGTYDGSTMTFRSQYDNNFYWYEYGPGPANGTGPGTDAIGYTLEIEVALEFK